MTDTETQLQCALEKISVLEESNKSLERKLSCSDAFIRKNKIMDDYRGKQYNLLFHGLRKLKQQESMEESEQVVRTFLSKKLRFPLSKLDKVQFAHAHRLKRKPSTAEPASGPTKSSPPIVVKFCKMADRNAVLALASQARQFDCGITNHLPVSMLEQRRPLLRHASRFYKKGKNVRWRVVEADYCLFVDGERFTVDDVSDIASNILPFNSDDG